MANKTYIQFTAGTPAPTDVFLLANPSSGQLKKVTVASLGLPAGTTTQTLRYDISGVIVANSILTNDGTKVKVTTNDALIHDIFTLQNQNSSAPVYVVFQNAAGAEKFYIGYRQAQTRADIVSADSLVGLSVDNTGRTLIGMYNSVYIAPDTGYIVSVDSLTTIGANGMVLRKHEGAGGIPVAWKMQNSTLSTLVEYAHIQGEVIANTAGAHTGKIIFSTARAGTVSDRVSIDESGRIRMITPSALSSPLANGTLEYVDDGTTGHLYFTRNVAGVATRVQLD